MINLSVNVNKIATLRNSRGGSVPAVTRAVGVILDAGAEGITVHPRADERHIRPGDVREVAAHLSAWRSRTGGHVEFNIEGDPRPDFVALVLEVHPDQCTLVPVLAGEITSQAGWPPKTGDSLAPVVLRLQTAGIRVSLFVDPVEASIRWAAGLGADRVELYTEPFARAFEQGAEAARASFGRYAAAAELAHRLDVGVNAGHDLDLDNLVLFRTLPHLAEVSIGHALVAHALWTGLERAVRDYRRALTI